MAGIVLMTCATLASAQGLDDPTRPPPSAMSPGSVPVETTSSAPQVQSILVSREHGGRRVAVINGVTVRQGAKFQGAVVERVGETEVVLRRGKSLETLKLFPASADGSPAVKP
ncbi:MAG: MSHA biogenesis protein MshK [Pseudomonadota bacterium]